MFSESASLDEVEDDATSNQELFVSDGTEVINQEAQDSPHESNVAAPASTIAGLELDIGLVKDVAADGSPTYCESTRLRPRVEASILNYVKEAQQRYARAWKARFLSDYQCAAMGITSHATCWVDGIAGKFACRRCFGKHRACVFFDRNARKLAVLPVPPEMRDRGTTPGSDGYYISDDSAMVKDGPWQKEKTLKRKPTV